MPFPDWCKAVQKQEENFQATDNTQTQPIVSLFSHSLSADIDSQMVKTHLQMISWCGGNEAIDEMLEQCIFPIG